MESDKNIEINATPTMDRANKSKEKEIMKGQKTADNTYESFTESVLSATEIPTINKAHGPSAPNKVVVDERIEFVEKAEAAPQTVLTSEGQNTVDVVNTVSTIAENKEVACDTQTSNSYDDMLLKATTASDPEADNLVLKRSDVTEEAITAEENCVAASIQHVAIQTFEAENGLEAHTTDVTADKQEAINVTEAQQQNNGVGSLVTTTETPPMAVDDNVANTSTLEVSLMITNQSSPERSAEPLFEANKFMTTETSPQALENHNDALSTYSLQSFTDSRIHNTVQCTTEAETNRAKASIASQVAAKTPSSGLSLLAQYDTDSEDDDVQHISDQDEEVIQRISDTESVEEVPTTTSREYRSRVVEIDSDSDSDSDSSEDEVEYLAEIRKAIDKSIDVDADAGDDDDFDENGIKTKRQPPRVKGEFLIDDLPPIQDLHITVPEAECVELGKVHSIVDQLVLVNALPDSVLLDLETVLFLEKGQRVLGEVFDVLGQVADPLYCVRFNSHKQIIEKNIKIGDVVFVAPKTQYTQFVILSSLMKMRGSDASWENDVEPPPRYIDYSDDEQERDARHRLRNRDRSVDYNDPTKRAREDLQADSPSPLPRNPFNQPPMRGRRGGIRVPSRYQHPSQEFQQRPSNYNPGSWHSNYPQHYAMPPPSFAVPPPQHVMYAPPPNFAAYPPHAVSMQPYPLAQPSQRYPAAQPNLQSPHHFAAAQPNIQQPPPTPMYVLNPYAVRPPVLASTNQPPAFYAAAPPPPPPGSQ